MNIELLIQPVNVNHQLCLLLMYYIYITHFSLAYILILYLNNKLGIPGL